jgi:hypothetical protein
MTMQPKKLAAVVPPKVKQVRVLFDRTQGIIDRLGERLNAPLICYWTSVNGSVCNNDVVALNEVLGRGERVPLLYLFIKSDGGNGRASLRMVNLLRRKCERLVALVPLNCESAATMLALGADEIHMGPMAQLSAVDTALTHDLSPVDKDNDRVSVGTNEVNRIVSLWNGESRGRRQNPYPELYKYIHPLVIGAVNRAGSLATMLCEQILAYHVPSAARRRKISHTLNFDYPSHGYPIVLREAQRIGLAARDLDERVEADLLALNELYSEMGQKHRTDFDEHHHHDNEIVNIHEAAGIQVRFQIDKDWHYRQTDRTWVFTNEESRWRAVRSEGGREVESVLHIR